jgi:hypothetical protein
MRWFIVSLSLFWTVASSAEVATIYLSDGSTIVGEVRSLESGIYLIEGGSLGRMEIPQDQVRMIQYGATPGALPDEQRPNAQLLPVSGLDTDSLLASMLANPTILSIIQSIQSDPEFQAVAQDPEIQKAITAGDYFSLMTDPRIRQLMSHGAVKAISAEVQR